MLGEDFSQKKFEEGKTVVSMFYDAESSHKHGGKRASHEKEKNGGKRKSKGRGRTPKGIEKVLPANREHPLTRAQSRKLESTKKKKSQERGRKQKKGTRGHKMPH